MRDKDNSEETQQLVRYRMHRNPHDAIILQLVHWGCKCKVQVPYYNPPVVLRYPPFREAWVHEVLLP